MIKYLVLEFDTFLKQNPPRPIIWEYDHDDIKEAEKAREKIMKKYSISPENIAVVSYRE